MPSLTELVRVHTDLAEDDVAWLHLLQPIARMVGRLRGLMSPPEVGGSPHATGIPWKLPPARTSPASGSTIGLSLTALASIDRTPAA